MTVGGLRPACWWRFSQAWWRAAQSLKRRQPLPPSTCCRWRRGTDRFAARQQPRPAARTVQFDAGARRRLATADHRHLADHPAVLPSCSPSGSWSAVSTRASCAISRSRPSLITGSYGAGGVNTVSGFHTLGTPVDHDSAGRSSPCGPKPRTDARFRGAAGARWRHSGSLLMSFIWTCQPDQPSMLMLGISLFRGTAVRAGRIGRPHASPSYPSWKLDHETLLRLRFCSPSCQPSLCAAERCRWQQFQHPRRPGAADRRRRVSVTALVGPDEDARLPTRPRMRAG